MPNFKFQSNADAGSGIENTLNKVGKAMDTAAMGGVAGLSTNVLVRENLSGIITRLPYRETNIRDRLPRKPGNGLAASWNVLTGITAGNSPFAEGGTPAEDDATYARRDAPFKELGKTKSITDKALMAGKNFADQDAEQTLNGLREVIQDEEQLLISGDSTGFPLQFDGLESYITTNLTDDANSPLGFRADLIDGAVEVIWSTNSVRPNAIYSGYGMKRAINQSLIGDVRVELTNSNTVAAGLDVGFIQTMVGKLPIVPTFAIAPDVATYPGNTVEDLYVVTEQAFGNEVLYMEDLYPLGKQMLDRVGAAIKFMITECTVMVCRAEEFQTRIQNIRTK
jgi:hypothetical protein